jgi:hypothetical protein
MQPIDGLTALVVAERTFPFWALADPQPEPAWDAGNLLNPLAPRGAGDGRAEAAQSYLLHRSHLPSVQMWQ